MLRCHDAFSITKRVERPAQLLAQVAPIFVAGDDNRRVKFNQVVDATLTLPQ